MILFIFYFIMNILNNAKIITLTYNYYDDQVTYIQNLKSENYPLYYN